MTKAILKFNLDLQEKLRKRREPPKTWRGRISADRPVLFTTGPQGPGEILSQGLFPSKDLAETETEKWLKVNYSKLAALGVKVVPLPAVPEEEPRL